MIARSRGFWKAWSNMCFYILGVEKSALRKTISVIRIFQRFSHFIVYCCYEKYGPDDDNKKDLYVSYAPKKTNPPIDIHITRGCIPLKKTAFPSSFAKRCTTSPTPKYGTPNLSVPSINRVLTTSNGQVSAAAIPPATEPHAAACIGLHSATNPSRDDDDDLVLRANSNFNLS